MRAAPAPEPAARPSHGGGARAVPLDRPLDRPIDRSLARPRALVGALVVLLALVGCGDLRLETPPPAPPVPGPAELVRARTVDDARALAEAAGAAAGAPALGDPVLAALAQVGAAAQAHVAALGGPVEQATAAPADAPGDAPTTGTPTGSAGATTGAPTTPTPAPAPAPADVVSLLATAAGTAGADALAVPDAGLAGLVASVAVSRWSSARALAAAAGVEAPAWVLPVAGATPEVTPTADAGPTPASTVGPDPATTPAPGTAAGVPDADAVALAAAEDAAGYALEVVAAVLGGEERDRALADARVHRDRAEAWARAAEVSGTAADPRRVAYALPAHVEDPATARTVARDAETALAAAHAAALARTPQPAARPDLLERLRAATDAATTWGAAPAVFPGRPDLG